MERRERRDSNPRPPACQAGKGATATVGCGGEFSAGAVISSSSEPAVTGYYLLPPGRACVAGVWRMRCQFGQRMLRSSIEAAEAELEQLRRRPLALGAASLAVAAHTPGLPGLPLNPAGPWPAVQAEP